MDVNKLFEELYVKNAPSWSIERDPDGSYKYHATQSAFLLFEQQQIEIESLKVDLTKGNAVPVWISVNDQLPESQLNVLVKIDSKNIKNEAYMVAHFIPKHTEEFLGFDDYDWSDYCEEKDMNFLPEGWYANTTYISDEYASYGMSEKVTHWMQIPEAQEPSHD